MPAFSSCGEWGLLLLVARGLLIEVVSLVLEQGSRHVGFRSCSTWAQHLWHIDFSWPCGMWNLPRPGIEHLHRQADSYHCTTREVHPFFWTNQASCRLSETVDGVQTKQEKNCWEKQKDNGWNVPQSSFLARPAHKPLIFNESRPFLPGLLSWSFCPCTLKWSTHFLPWNISLQLYSSSGTFLRSRQKVRQRCYSNNKSSLPGVTHPAGPCGLFNYTVRSQGVQGAWAS